MDGGLASAQFRPLPGRAAWARVTAPLHERRSFSTPELSATCWPGWSPSPPPRRRRDGRPTSTATSGQRPPLARAHGLRRGRPSEPLGGLRPHPDCRADRRPVPPDRPPLRPWRHGPRPRRAMAPRPRALAPDGGRRPLVRPRHRRQQGPARAQPRRARSRAGGARRPPPRRQRPRGAGDGRGARQQGPPRIRRRQQGGAPRPTR